VGQDRAYPNAEKPLGRRGAEGEPGAAAKPVDGESSRVDPGKEGAGTGKLGPKQLAPKQQEEVKDLEARDREVRAHEAAHQAAAGGLGGGASFEYQTGPDGKSYAVGGEVSIDMSPGRTPEETIRRAQQVRAAALAPADPSPQDMAVAASATQMESAARQQQVSQAPEDDGAPPPTDGAKPKDDAAERAVEDRHFQALVNVAADRANQAQSVGQRQRLASRAISAYLG
jgi:hypothetical protein